MEDNLKVNEAYQQFETKDLDEPYIKKYKKNKSFFVPIGMIKILLLTIVDPCILVVLLKIFEYDNFKS